MDFNKFRNQSITRGKGILGVFGLCSIAVGLFILIASYINNAEVNLNSLLAIITGGICFYVAMTRKVN